MENNDVVHPGKLLLSEITKRDMKQKELAIRTGVSEKHISTIINGTKDLSVSFARKLDIALGSEPGTWAGNQTKYDLKMAALEEQNGITEDERKIFKNIKDIVDYFLEIDILHNHCGISEKIIQLRKVLCVNSLTVIPQITYNAAYRAQVKSSTAVDPYILFAWQRLCELQAQNIKTDNHFDIEKLSDSITKIKTQMFEDDPNVMVSNLKSIFAECGVTFNVVRHFHGAPVQGFIKQADNGKVLLCVTIRGKDADRFWFTLFHEVGHLLNGDLNNRFVDFDKVKTEPENKANTFAEDTLIDRDLYKEFLDSGNYRDLISVKRFAKKIGVPHWIVIGRLHNDERLDWSCFAREIPKFAWIND